VTTEREAWEEGKIHVLDPCPGTSALLTSGRPGQSELGVKLCRELLSARAVGQHSQLLVFRITNYDLLVDTYGADFGTAAETALMQRLRGLLRRREPVQLIRPGEFGIVGRGVRSEQALRAMASRMMYGGTGYYEIDGIPCRLQLEIGAAASPTDSEDPEELLRFARFALRQPGDGVDSCHAFSLDALNQQKAALRMEAELEKALEEQRFTLQYQPQFSINTGSVAGVEVLVRMVRPDGSRVPPNEFIPIAEDNGSIRRLGYWVIREACEQLARWRSEGLEVPRMSLNLSPHQLTDTGLILVIEDAVCATGIDYKDLEFEITERCMLEASSRVSEMLALLRDRGVRLAIDDFGTGYSSFAYLAWQPLDLVKLDRSFLARLGHDDRTRAVLAGMIDMAHRLGLELVAEGVENDEQADFVKKLGCDIAQGFALARPEDPEEISRLLADNHLKTTELTGSDG
jgi:EAL domain-containing protein (putative c-di-GMP-specific phosphodiesterase class I)/GGDEF domain-containing protein